MKISSPTNESQLDLFQEVTVDIAQMPQTHIQAIGHMGLHFAAPQPPNRYIDDPEIATIPRTGIPEQPVLFPLYDHEDGIPTRDHILQNITRGCDMNVSKLHHGEAGKQQQLMLSRLKRQMERRMQRGFNESDRETCELELISILRTIGLERRNPKRDRHYTNSELVHKIIYGSRHLLPGAPSQRFSARRAA